jgi:hypothetical protein
MGKGHEMNRTKGKCIQNFGGKIRKKEKKPKFGKAQMEAQHYDKSSGNMMEGYLWFNEHIIIINNISLHTECNTYYITFHCTEYITKQPFLHDILKQPKVIQVFAQLNTKKMVLRI